MENGRPYSSQKALQYHSPESFEKPYDEMGGGILVRSDSLLGKRSVDSKTMDEEMYTIRFRLCLTAASKVFE